MKPITNLGQYYKHIRRGFSFILLKTFLSYAHSYLMLSLLVLLFKMYLFFSSTTQAGS